MTCHNFVTESLQIPRVVYDFRDQLGGSIEILSKDERYFFPVEICVYVYIYMCVDI